MHDMNVARLRTTGVINPNAARVSLSNLRQGSSDVELYMTSWRRLHDDAFDTADPTLRRSECIDGLSRKLRDDRKELTPHVVPFHPRIRARDKAGDFAGLDFAGLCAEFELEEASMREEMLLTALEPYAPFESKQVGSDNTGDSNASRDFSLQAPMGNSATVNAVEAAKPMNTTATLADLDKLHTQIDLANNKQYTALDLKIDALAVSTADQIKESNSQTQKQMLNFENSLAELVTASQSIGANIQKLTNASAGRDAPVARKQFVFKGKCYNCGQEGHQARNCRDKAQRKMVNALTANGSQEAKDHPKFEEQFQTHETATQAECVNAFINCLMNGIQEDGDSNAAGVTEVNTSSAQHSENSRVQGPRFCGIQGVRQKDRWERTVQSCGDIIEAAERGLSGDRWIAEMQQLAHWVRSHKQTRDLTFALGVREAPGAAGSTDPSSHTESKPQVTSKINAQTHSKLTPTVAGSDKLSSDETNRNNHINSSHTTKEEDIDKNHDSSNAVTTITKPSQSASPLPAPKSKAVTKTKWLVTLLRGNQMGLISYCIAAKPTPVGVRQVRFAVANTPWMVTAASPQEVTEIFESLSNGKVLEHRAMLQPMQHKGAKAAGLQLILVNDGKNIRWEGTQGRNVKRAPTKWFTKVDKFHNKSQIDLNKPQNVLWGDAGNMLMGLESWMETSDKLRYFKLLHQSVHQLHQLATEKKAAGRPSAEDLELELKEKGIHSHWRRVFTLTKYKLLSPSWKIRINAVRAHSLSLSWYQLHRKICEQTLRVELKITARACRQLANCWKQSWETLWKMCNRTWMLKEVTHQAVAVLKLLRPQTNKATRKLPVERNEPLWNHWSKQKAWKNVRWLAQQHMKIRMIATDLRTAVTAVNTTFVGSRKNPIRSTRILLLNENNQALAGTIPIKLSRSSKSFSPKGLPNEIQCNSNGAELWLPGGKVDLKDGKWEGWKDAASRELKEEVGRWIAPDQLTELNPSHERLVRHKGKHYWLKFVISRSTFFTPTKNEEFEMLSWHDLNLGSLQSTSHNNSAHNWHLNWLIWELKHTQQISKIMQLTKEQHQHTSTNLDPQFQWRRLRFRLPFHTGRQELLEAPTFEPAETLQKGYHDIHKSGSTSIEAGSEISPSVSTPIGTSVGTPTATQIDRTESWKKWRERNGGDPVMAHLKQREESRRFKSCSFQSAQQDRWQRVLQLTSTNYVSTDYGLITRISVDLL